jgi:long-chain acyl-CoA synthetase
MYLGTFADSHPERMAIVMEDGSASLTYAELEAASNRFAHALARFGLVPGDVVAIMLENSVEWAVAWWGTVRSGMYLTPINWHLAAEEVEYILENSEARVLVTGEATADAAARASEGRPSLVIIQVGAGDRPEGRVLDFDAVLSAEPATRIDRELAGAPMFYSSGTTGRPKGIKAVLPGEHPSAVAGVAYQMVTNFGMVEGDHYLNPAPLYHGAPASFTFGAHCIGATAVVMKRFDAERALRLIQDEQITISQWVPTMFQRLLALPDEVKQKYDLSSNRVAVHAAAPCAPSVKQAMIAWWGPILLEYYGASECGATVITSPEWLERPGSVGRPWNAGTKMVILDAEKKQPVPPGVEGLVYFEPLSAHRIEYYKDPEKTKGIYHDGMITAGDIGYVDEDGYLYLTDRLSNMIISGGVNIYPQEVEYCLGDHPDVLDVAVFGIPNDEFGEEVKAVVQVQPDLVGDPALADRLTAYCREHLAGFKVPRSFDFVQQMPRDDNGKLYKRRLRDPYWEGRDSRVV